MKDPARREVSCGGRHRIARLASADLLTLGHDGRAARGMNRPIHAAPARECGIGRVDNGVDGQRGDVATDY